MSSQILIELGKISAQIAAMNEQLKSIPDHESRIRALERFRFTIVGAVITVSAVFSGLGTWIGVVLTHHH